MRAVVVPSSADYRRKAGQASARNAGRYCIEGELLTYAQIGARLGVSASVAGERMKRERNSDGPVTWQGLSR